MAILTQESENRLKIFLGTDKFPCTGEKFPEVYKIVCLPTNKVYVGSSSRCVYRRFKDRRGFLRAKTHHSILLQRAWDKYKPEEFQFEVLEFCTPDECIAKEQYYINRYKAANSEFGFNISPFAGSNKGSKFKRTHPIAPKSQKSIELMKAALKGKPKSKEHAAKVGLAKAIPIVQLSIIGTLLNVWKAAEYAARDLKLHQGNIVNCCKGKRKTTGGYKWMYKSDYYGNIRTGNS